MHPSIRVNLASLAVLVLGCTSSELKLSQNDPAHPAAPVAPAAPSSGVLNASFDPLAAETPAADAGGRKYTCPMHPEVVKDEPGLCPKCNMKLVPAKEKQTHSHEH